jgi:uncharacterized protein YbaR (Trm112 family)
LTAIVVACPYCKHAGAVDSRLAGEGNPPEPIFTTDGFHIETGRTANGAALVICDACDEIIVV